MRVRVGGIPWCICVVAVIGVCDRRVGTAWRHTPVIHDDPDRRPTRNAVAITGPSQSLRCWVGEGTPLIAAEPLSWVSPRFTSCCHCRGAPARAPLFFPLLDLSSAWCVLAICWPGPQCVCAAVAAFLPVFADGVTLWTCGSLKGTQHDGFGCVCCLCIASRCGCKPASGMSTPSRFVGLVHIRCQWCRDPRWAQWFREVACGNRGRRAHIGYPR